jgi:cell division cycle 2-like protein
MRVWTLTNTRLPRRTLHAGTSEVDQLQKIFSVLGLPTATKWPLYAALPHAPSLKWKASLGEKSKLRDKFPRPSSSSAFTDVNAARHLSDVGFGLLEGLLNMDPAQRLSAKDALAHPWFQEEPLALPNHQMPTYPSANKRE